MDSLALKILSKSEFKKAINQAISVKNLKQSRLRQARCHLYKRLRLAL